MSLRSTPAPGLAFSAVLAVLAAVACVSGCNRLERTTMSHRSSEDGVYTIHVQTTVEANRATFACLVSRSGTCRILVYSRTCEMDVSLREGRLGEECETRALGMFKLRTGERRVVTGLPKGFRQCVATDAMPSVPGCVM
jgi:hypothetical protein